MYSTLAAAGVGSCSNQVPTALNADAAPTCTTLTSAYVDATVAKVIGNGTAVMTTAAITAPACGTTVTVASASVVATDTIEWAFNAAPAGSNAGLVAWPTSGNVNFAYCPGVTETHVAATINWRVIR